VIRLSARLAVSGGRESVVRLALTALGVALGTTLLLLAVAADPVIRAHQRQQAWQDTGEAPADLTGPGDPLLWQLTTDGVDGDQLVVLRVAPLGPHAVVPVGLPHVPSPGEVYVSPALARRIEELPADRLADRFPSAPAGMIERRYLAGPDELVAVVGHAPADLEGRRGVLEVHHQRERPVTFEYPDLLRLILGIGAVGLLLPVVIFVATSTRLGAARREQRLAALRLAGATPGQTRVVAAVEAGVAAAVGVVVGAVAFQPLRSVMAGIEIDGQPSFVSDVRLAPALLLAVLLAVPALAVVAALVSLRRLRVSPLGVARRAVRARPTVRRLLPLVVGGSAFVITLGFVTDGAGTGVVVAAMATFGLMIYGIVNAGPWLTVLVARAIGRLGRRPSALLAARRLEDDPAAGFRAVSGLVLAVFVVSVFSGVSPALRAEVGSEIRDVIADTTLVSFLPPGTGPETAAEALVAATAAGAGRGIVLHAPPVPAAGASVSEEGELLVACADVDVLGVEGSCPAGGSAHLVRGAQLSIAVAPFTEGELDGFTAEAVVVETDGDPAATDRVRTAIQRAAPGADAQLGREIEAEANDRLRQIERLSNLALAVSLLVAGCSLAVAVAGGIIERKRPFALLRLSGMHLAELRQVALMEAAGPLLLIALASALLGLGVSATIVPLAGEAAWTLPSPWYWLSLVGGLALALGVAAAALPLLSRVTEPSAVRFE
jgi:cell division protein FtsX